MAVYSAARVRQALNLAFDFEWANQNLFYGQYTRSRSYFNNSPSVGNTHSSGDGENMRVFGKGVLRIAATAQECTDTVSDFPRSNVLANGDNFTRDLEPQSFGHPWGGWVSALALANIGTV
jgi:hypothetical protein